MLKSKISHLSIGRKGEKIVCREMRRMGMTVLRVNYSVHKKGEIDIVGRDGSCLVFVEVKTRSENTTVRPGEAVNLDKKIKLWKTAKSYLREIDGRKLRYRFDVAEVYYRPFWRSEVFYLPAAFDMDDIKKFYKYSDYSYQ